MVQEQKTTGKKIRVRRPEKQRQSVKKSGDQTPKSSLISLHHQVGNRVVQQLIAQRKSGNSPFELDDMLADRITHERSGGQPLDETVSQKLEPLMGADLSGVRVHTTPESDTLNQEIGAKAFTTGQDMFFRAGAYQPGSSSGQELITHELTHVVQQGTGSVSGASGGKMVVNAPGDVYEQQADATARSVMSVKSGAQAQGQVVQTQEEEEEVIQSQEEEEEVIQSQAEEEEVVQSQEADEEEMQVP